MKFRVVRPFIVGLIFFSFTALTVSAASKEIRGNIISIAEEQLGQFYEMDEYTGGWPPGFDCSGLVSYSYLQARVKGFSGTTPSSHGPNTTALVGMSDPVLDELYPGDLIFLNGTYDKNLDGVVNAEDLYTHVGIYVGNDIIIHAGSPVQKAKLSEWKNDKNKKIKFAGIRHIKAQYWPNNDNGYVAEEAKQIAKTDTGAEKESNDGSFFSNLWQRIVNLFTKNNKNNELPAQISDAGDNVISGNNAQEEKPAQEQLDERQGWKEYTSQKLNYSIKYPNDWFKLNDFGIATDEYFSNNKDIDAPLYMGKDGIWLTIRAEKSSTLYEKVFSEKTGNTFKDSSSYLITKLGDMTIDGKSAVKFAREASPEVKAEGTEYGYAIVYAIQNGNSIYSITFLTLGGDKTTATKNSNTYELLATSFKSITPPSSATPAQNQQTKQSEQQSQPPPTTPNIEYVKEKVKQYYDNKGEWAGIFVIDNIDKVKLEKKSETEIIAHILYKYKPAPVQTTYDMRIGYDQRIFLLKYIGSNWEVIKMSEYMSAN